MNQAYFAKFVNEDWGCLVHGETREKAKHRFMRIEPSGWAEHDWWTDIRLRRIPGLDDKPITYDSAKEAGFEYEEEADDPMPLPPEEFYNFCDCEICRPERMDHELRI